jgi:nicotinamidase-related amidase
MPKTNRTGVLPLPPHYDPLKVGQVWRVEYQERSRQAAAWRAEHNLQPASKDSHKLALLLVDVQNTFCIPGFELFVGGRSGMGAVEDNRRLCEFIYRNLGAISHITASLDTHHAMQIFHPVFLINDMGEHPGSVTLVTSQDVRNGIWRFNPAIAPSLGITPEYGQQQLQHYVDVLKTSSKYDLTIWPYHAMLGGIGHALVSAVEEALFFHTLARSSQAQFEIKGDQSLTEHYSILRPEVMTDPKGKALGRNNDRFMQLLMKSDRLIIAGQAKSHCVAFTITDLLEDIRQVDERLAHKVYLLEDCMSPVVIPGLVDYTEQAEQTFRGFKEAGMHLVRSSDPLETWPG